MNDLRQKPQSLSAASKCTTLLFGGRSGTRQFVIASIIDRLVFVPLVLVPLALTGVFTHLFLTFTILDALLAMGAWALVARA